MNFTDWTDGPLWLEPPHLDDRQKRQLEVLRRRVPHEADTVWVLSSGTESVGRLKCLGLSRGAILASAAAVNAHLRSTASDRWLIAIPTYHVGGFAIGARAHQSGAGVDRLAKWSAPEFTEACASYGTTLTSLVPTQIFDLVRAGRRAPKALRAIVVGGGALEPKLYADARRLGWPVLPSYGLTETASQIATASLDATADGYPDLEILSHARVEIADGRVRVRATSLAHARAVVDRYDAVVVDDPREDGWLVTEDLAEWGPRGGLSILGRRDDVVKILGVLVTVPGVEAELRECVAEPERLIVMAIGDARRGSDLVAVTDGADSLAALARAIDAYNARVAEPRRVARMMWVPQLPRTALGKIKRAALREWLAP